MLSNNEFRVTLSFYKYCDIYDPYNFKKIIYKVFNILNILGRVYISREGINAQISVLNTNYHIFKKFIYKMHHDFKGMKINRGLNNKTSFFILKVKVKNKIVADGLLNFKFNYKNSGIYLKPHEVNNMLVDKKAIFVDLRNDYEYKIGHFKKAIHVPGSTFRDQLNNMVKFLTPYKNKSIVMYCTGGIRCEKATALIKFHNFKNVYHIEGGILNYVNESHRKNLPIKFYGKNFVFDNRISEFISSHIFSLCETCGQHYNDYMNCNNYFCHRLFLQCKNCYIKYSGYCSINCQIKYI
ncbi:rhodanese-related sulfurtransferase [Buchnera aphidicola]|uniref:oxygen-dependent tRNA uridine(34) hydroxylase TrhO n=1 Tax=Buchnera aphidicola TaxID=9 RepID=UPI0034644D06